jgi:hypothetical protein
VVGYASDEWLGFGYLGERRSALDSSDPESQRAHLVDETDDFVLDYANQLGWTADELFAWANSKNGRWLGDVAFGGGRLAKEGPALMVLPR